MSRLVRISVALILSSVALAAFGSPDAHHSTGNGRARGYGLIVGDVGPCTARRFDAQPGEPLIVILTKNNQTYVTYNVSADTGTTWYHFDVPVGRYTLSTTWWGSKNYEVLVKFGKTSTINLEVSCGTFST